MPARRHGGASPNGRRGPANGESSIKERSRRGCSIPVRRLRRAARAAMTPPSLLSLALLERSLGVSLRVVLRHEVPRDRRLVRRRRLRALARAAGLLRHGRSLLPRVWSGPDPDAPRSGGTTEHGCARPGRHRTTGAQHRPAFFAGRRTVAAQADGIVSLLHKSA